MNKRVDFPVAGLDSHHHDEDSNTSGNPSFMDVLEAGLNRRAVLKGSVGTAATAVLASWLPQPIAQ